MATSATTPNGRILRAAAVVVPVGRDGLVPPSLTAYQRGLMLQTHQLRSVESTAAGERVPLLSTCRPRLGAPPKPGGDASLVTATVDDRSASCSSLSDPTVATPDDDSEITSASGDLVDEPLGDAEDERQRPVSLRRGSSGESSNGGGQSLRRRLRGNLERAALQLQQQSKPTGSGSIESCRREAPTSTLPIRQSIESGARNNDIWTPTRGPNDYVTLPKFECYQQQSTSPQQLQCQSKTTTNTSPTSSIGLSFASLIPTSKSTEAPLQTPEVRVSHQPSSSSVSVGVGIVVASPFSTVVKRQSSGGGGGDIDSMSDAFSGGTTGWRRRGKMSSLRGLVQSKIYNFLERPTGWKCFTYHFSV